MQQRMNATLAKSRFAVIGKNARHVLPFLSQAGAVSVSFYENYDSFDSRDGFDAIFASDNNILMACVNSKAYEVKAVGFISTEQINQKIKELIPSTPIFSSNINSVRSVSEYVIASIFLSLRNFSNTQINDELNYEIKGKTLGIIGYGKVGVQVSVLAESLGMNVIFYDSDTKLNIGNSRQISKISELLSASDVVLISTSPAEHAVLTENELHMLKQGCSLINIAGQRAIELAPLFNLLQARFINCLVMDLDADDSAEEVTKVKGMLSSLSNVCLTRGEQCRTSEALHMVSRDVVGNVLDFLDKNQALATGSTLAGEELSFIPV